MKKVSLLLGLLLVFVATTMVACKPKKVVATEGTVCISVIEKEDCNTLLEYMQILEDAGELTFEHQDGFVTSINGRANTDNGYWLLYTDITEKTLATSDFTYEYEGKTLNSALYGAAEMPILRNQIYVWVYSIFE